MQPADLNFKSNKKSTPELRLPSGCGLEGLLTPPALVEELMGHCCFLSSFRHQIGLHEVDVSLRGLDRALSGDAHTSSVAVHIHVALMRLLGPESPTNAQSRALANALKEAWVLAWQETVADFLKWQGHEDDDAAEAVRMLRAGEYHTIPPRVRFLILRLLVEPAMDAQILREAIDRRAEWAQAQSWSWDVAGALGRVHHRFELHQISERNKRHSAKRRIHTFDVT